MFLPTICRLGLISSPEKSHPQPCVFKLIQFCCHTAQPIYHSNLYKCHSSIQAYVSCILRLHSSWGLCKANLSWINQEIPWCMLYVEEDILFRSRREVLPSLLKWTNLLSAVYLSTFWNTSKYLPDPCGCVPQTCRTPGLKNNSLITWGTGDFQVRSQAMHFTSPQKELRKWKKGPMWSPGQQDFCKAKEEGRRKITVCLFSQPVFWIHLRKSHMLFKFKALQLTLLSSPLQNTGCGLAPLPPFSHGNAPDKNTTFQPTSN